MPNKRQEGEHQLVDELVMDSDVIIVNNLQQFFYLQICWITELLIPYKTQNLVSLLIQ